MEKYQLPYIIYHLANKDNLLMFIQNLRTTIFWTYCRWYSHNTPGEPLPVLTGPRVRLLGPVLAIEAVTAEDAGIYKCSAANAGETELNNPPVRFPWEKFGEEAKVHYTPKLLSI